MSETTLDFDPGDAVEPVRSGWRRALVVFAVLGAGAYAAGRLAARDDSGTIPTLAMILLTMLGPLVALLGFGLWWVLLGDGRWWQRLLASFGVGVLAVGAVIAAHPSMRQFILGWGVPLTAGVTGLVLAAVPAARRWPVAGAIALVALVPWLALRVDGVNGEYEMHTSYRWKQSVVDAAAEQLADRATVVPTGTVADLPPAGPLDYPGFRGANRDGRVPEAAYRGWDGSPPKERWRNNPVGPAWSSFCAVGEFVFTQEQRGESESVVCYRADTGKEVWSRGQPGKHSDGQSGSGPRATPTYANGRLFAIGASGSVSCLRAESGEPVWTVNLAERFGATKPNFGLSTSPLVVGDLVVINPSSSAAPRLVALDGATGATRWAAEPHGADGYSSPQSATIAGAEQVLIFNNAGLFGHDPRTGGELWHYDWPVKIMEPTAVQPLVLPDGRVVIGGGNVGLGSRCVKVRREGAGWAAGEVWKTTRFTPKFNDMVHVGEALFGLDSGRLVCLDLKNGSVRWKEGNYGAGQLLLVGDRLLIVCESPGQLACVAAKPDEYEELWKVDVVKEKTWNHPVIARGRLFFRNATEMVAFDLPGWSGGP
ncbi:MAG: PQQ-binding-like beta-propeller repeat protein [Planctomycetes bacterium]|nr:PQQ-binding-like beta-propeller repeat protein [Planctomycetota bacterium]